MSADSYNLLSSKNFIGNKTLDEIVKSLITVYSKILIDREEKGNSYKGMSRRDYNAFRTEDELTARAIEIRLGSWSKTKRLLPKNDDLIQRVPYTEYTVENVSNIIRKVAREYDINPGDIGILEFNEYRKNHPEENVRHWESYSKKMGYGRKWKDFIHGVLKQDYINGIRK